MTKFSSLLLAALAVSGLAAGCTSHSLCDDGNCVEGDSKLDASAPEHDGGTPTLDAAFPDSDAAMDQSDSGKGSGGPLNTEAYVELVQDGKTQRLMAPCGKYSHDASPYAEVIDPDASSARLVVDACGAEEVYLDFVASLVQHDPDSDSPFPEQPEVIRLRFSDPKTGQEWIADKVEVTLTALGKVGEYVDGTFSAQMPGTLSHKAGTITGSFHTPRQDDRFSP